MRSFSAGRCGVGGQRQELPQLGLRVQVVRRCGGKRRNRWRFTGNDVWMGKIFQIQLAVKFSMLTVPNDQHV